MFNGPYVDEGGSSSRRRLGGEVRRRRRRRGGFEDGGLPPIGEFGNLLVDRGSAHTPSSRVIEATLLPKRLSRSRA